MARRMRSWARGTAAVAVAVALAAWDFARLILDKIVAYSR
jgi:hypothetical protein